MSKLILDMACYILWHWVFIRVVKLNFSYNRSSMHCSGLKMVIQQHNWIKLDISLQWQALPSSVGH